MTAPTPPEAASSVESGSGTRILGLGPGASTTSIEQALSAARERWQLRYSVASDSQSRERAKQALDRLAEVERQLLAKLGLSCWPKVVVRCYSFDPNARTEEVLGEPVTDVSWRRQAMPGEQALVPAEALASELVPAPDLISATELVQPPDPISVFEPGQSPETPPAPRHFHPTEHAQDFGSDDSTERIDDSARPAGQSHAGRSKRKGKPRSSRRRRSQSLPWWMLVPSIFGSAGLASALVTAAILTENPHGYAARTTSTPASEQAAVPGAPYTVTSLPATPNSIPDLAATAPGSTRSIPDSTGSSTSGQAPNTTDRGGLATTFVNTTTRSPSSSTVSVQSPGGGQDLASASSQGDGSDHAAELELARAALARGAHTESLKLYQAILLQDPIEPYAHLGAAVALLALSRPAEAEVHCRQALATMPNFPQAHYDLAVSLHRQRRDDAAVSEFKRFLLMVPDDPAAPAARGFIARFRLANRH